MKAIICCRILILSMLLFHPLLCHGKPVNNDTPRVDNGFPNDREYGALQLPITSDKKSVCMIDRRRLLNDLDYVDGVEGRQSNVDVEGSSALSQSPDSEINSAQSSLYKENGEQSVISDNGVSDVKESSLSSLENSLRKRRSDGNEKLNTLMSIDEASLTQLEENNVHARVKRKSSSHKSKKGSSKKRSSKSSSKASRKSSASKDDSESDELSDIADDSEKDYIAEEELKAIDEKDENERQSNVQDMDSFVEQDERSNLYDDFEAKDVAKRGVENAGDYEEFQDDLPAPLNDAEFDEEVERHEDIRVKRHNEKGLENEAGEIASKEKRQSQTENSEDAKLDEGKLVSVSNQNNAKNDQLQDINSNSETARISEDEVKSDLDSTAKDSAKEIEPSIEYEKRSTANELEQKSAPISPLQAPSQAESVSNDREAGVQSGMRSERDLNGQKIVQSSDPSKTDSNLSSNEANNSLTPASKDQLSENTNKATDVKLTEEQGSSLNSNLIDSSKSMLASVTGDESDAEYRKRVEDQIQRKIDSIKEEIKRDIEENQRIREIEANNARFDELQTHEEDEDGQRISSGRDMADSQSVSKRSAAETKNSARKRDVGRKQRLSQSEIRRRLREVESAERSDSTIYQKSGLKHNGMRKRSVTQGEEAEQTEGTGTSSTRKKKRDYARQVFLVNDAQVKRRKRRRSRTAILIPEQAHVKVEDELPADFVLSAQLRDPVANSKNGLSSSVNAEGGVPEAEQSFVADGKSDTLVSLTGSSQELGPRLATEYKEAFGGLQDKPDGALARFKRIKRVLRTSNSKS